uniref:ABC-3 n=1 Tax=uncultured organism TaxID=155900 RepID=M1PVB7_9ZZZZ|nr:ABC-3 [uncultured organism]
MGSFVVQMDISAIGFSMSHAAFAGAALGLLLSFSPLLCAVGFALAVALLLGPVSQKAKLSPGVVTGVAFSVTMAIGFVFLNLQPGAAATGSALSILWGSVFALGWNDILMLALLSSVIVIVVFTFRKEFISILFDKKMAEATGLNTDPFYFAILFLTGLAVALSLKFVGGLLVFALIINTAAAANQFTYDIKKVLIISPTIGITSCITGCLISLQFNLPVGTSIVAITALTFATSITLSKKRKKENHSTSQNKPREKT